MPLKTAEELLKEIEEKYTGGSLYISPTVPEPILPEREVRPEPLGIPLPKPSPPPIPIPRPTFPEPIGVPKPPKEPTRQIITPIRGPSIVEGAERPILADVPATLASWGVNVPELYFRALRLGRKPEEAPILTSAIEKIQKVREEHPILQPPANAGYIRRALYEGLSQMGPSVMGGLPGATLTWLGKKLAGIKAGPLGALATWVGFALSAGVLFGRAEYDRFREEARAAGIDEDKAHKYALYSAIVEGGAETVADLIGAHLLGLIGKGHLVKMGRDVITKPLHQIIRSAIVPTIKQTAKRIAKQYPVEVTTEAFQEGMESWLRKQAGVPAPTPIESVLEVIGPTLVMTAGFGIGARLYSPTISNAMRDALVNEKAPIESRLAASHLISQSIRESASDFRKKEPETYNQMIKLADSWDMYSRAAIGNKQRINLVDAEGKPVNPVEFVYRTVEELRKDMELKPPSERVAELLEEKPIEPSEEATKEKLAKAQKIMEQNRVALAKVLGKKPEEINIEEIAEAIEKPKVPPTKIEKIEVLKQPTPTAKEAPPTIAKIVPPSSEAVGSFIHKISQIMQVGIDKYEEILSKYEETSPEVVKEIRNIIKNSEELPLTDIKSIFNKEGELVLYQNNIRRKEEVPPQYRRFFAPVISRSFDTSEVEKNIDLIPTAIATLRTLYQSHIKVFGKENTAIRVSKSEDGKKVNIDIGFMAPSQAIANDIAALSNQQKIYNETSDEKFIQVLDKEGAPIPHDAEYKLPTISSIKNILKKHKWTPKQKLTSLEEEIPEPAIAEHRKVPEQPIPEWQGRRDAFLHLSVVRGLVMSYISDFPFLQLDKNVIIYRSMEEFFQAHPERREHFRHGEAIAGQAIIVPWDLASSKIELVATGFRDATHIQQVLYEELSHIGIFAVFKERTRPWLLKLYDQISTDKRYSKDLSNLMTEYNFDPAVEDDRVRASMEWIGYQVMNRKNPPFLRELKGMIMTWFRKLFPRLAGNITDAEIDFAIMRSIQLMRHEHELRGNVSVLQEGVIEDFEHRVTDIKVSAIAGLTKEQFIQQKRQERNAEWEKYRKAKSEVGLVKYIARRGEALREGSEGFLQDIKEGKILKLDTALTADEADRLYPSKEWMHIFAGAPEPPLGNRVTLSRARDIIRSYGFKGKSIDDILSQAVFIGEKRISVPVDYGPYAGRVSKPMYLYDTDSVFSAIYDKLAEVKLRGITTEHRIIETGTYRGQRFTSAFGPNDIQYVIQNEQGEDMGRLWIKVQDEGIWVHKIEVDKKYQHQGIGTQLLVHAVKKHGKLLGTTDYTPEGREFTTRVFQRHPELYSDMHPKSFLDKPVMSEESSYSRVTMPSLESEVDNFASHWAWIKGVYEAYKNRKEYFESEPLKDMTKLEATYALPFWVAMKFKEFMSVIRVQFSRLEKNNKDILTLVKDVDDPSKNFPLMEMVLAKKDTSRVEQMIYMSDKLNIYPETDTELAVWTQQTFGFIPTEEEIYAYRGWKKGSDRMIDWQIDRLKNMAFDIYKDKPWGRHIRDFIEGAVTIEQLGLEGSELRSFDRAVEVTKERLRQIAELEAQLRTFNFYMHRNHGKGDFVIRAFHFTDENLEKMQLAIKEGKDRMEAIKEYGMTVYLRRAETETEAEILRREVEKKYPGHIITKTKEPVTQEYVYQLIDPAGLMAFMEAALERAQKRQDLTESEAEQLFEAAHRGIQEEFFARGGRKVQIGRFRERVIEGYDTTNLHRVYVDYISGVVGSIHKMEAAKEFFDAMQGIDPRAQKELWKYAKTYVQHMMRNPSSVDRKIQAWKTLPYAWFLASNLRMAAAQFCQNWMTAAPVLARYINEFGVSGPGAYSRLLRAMKDIATGNLSKDEKEMIEEAYLRGEINAIQINEFRGKIGGSWLKENLRKILDVVSLPFAGMEKFNRMTSHLAMYRLAKEAGINKEDAYRYAWEYTMATHYAYGTSNYPQFLREDTLLSKLGSLFWVFRSFTHNYLLSLKHYARTREGKIKFDVIGRSLAFLVLFGGLGTVPFLDDILEALEKLTGKMYRKEMRDLLRGLGGEMLASIGLEGLPALVGVDIGGTMRVEIPFIGEMRNTVYGVWAGLIDKGINGIDAVLEGDYTRAAEYFSPAGIEAMFKSVRQAREGLTTRYGHPILDEFGEPIRLTTGERVVQFLAFRPARISGIQKELRSIQNVEKYYQERRTDIYRKLRLMDWEDKDEVSELISDIQKYNMSVQKYGGAIPFITTAALKRATKPKPKLSKYYKEEVE